MLGVERVSFFEVMSEFHSSISHRNHHLSNEIIAVRLSSIERRNDRQIEECHPNDKIQKMQKLLMKLSENVRFYTSNRSREVISEMGAFP